MTTQKDCLDRVGKISVDAIEERGENFSMAPENRDPQEIDPLPAGLDFQPLSESERKEFVNSLDAKGKKMLAELEHRSEPYHETAAPTVRIVVNQ